jgi:hypothetical protein
VLINIHTTSRARGAHFGRLHFAVAARRRNEKVWREKVHFLEKRLRREKVFIFTVSGASFVIGPSQFLFQKRPPTNRFLDVIYPSIEFV